MLRPHLRAQLTTFPGAPPTPRGRMTTLPVRDYYQGTHWPKSLKCRKETTVSSLQKAVRIVLFLVLREMSIGPCWALGAWLQGSPEELVRDKGTKMFHNLIRREEHTSFFPFFLSKQTKILLKAKSLCLEAEREVTINFG